MSVDVETAWLSLRTQLAAHRSDQTARALDDSETPTPVCLLTGFLGAGKSFLIAELLKNPPADTRIKAIVNDVGALDFDPTLIESADDIRVELTNGCGCCERTAELAEALAALADGPACDLIVLEASGAADPLGLAQVVSADPSLRLDRIVAVSTAADVAATTRSTSVHSMPARPEPMASIARRQIDSAHCVIVSACDLVEPAVAAAAVDQAAVLAPGRTVTPSSRQMPATQVLLPTARRGARPTAAHADSIHQELAVTTVEQRREPTMAELRSVLEAARPGLVRAKGRLTIDGQYYLVQLTPQSINITDTSTGPTALTVISVEQADAQPLIELVGPPTPPERSAVPPALQTTRGDHSR